MLDRYRPWIRRVGLTSALWLEAALVGVSGEFSPPEPPPRPWVRVEVTAYNATRAQTDRNPWIAAWGDRLRPGMRVIAVSHDLLELGFDHGARVEIAGLPGKYVVMDKTHRRWSRRVDLFMGQDVQRAENWGKRRMRIRCIEACS
jgi:3D (Asp-Asp-Asp) domain-containing protein